MKKILLSLLVVTATGVAKDHEKAIKEGIKSLAPMATVSSINETPVKNISEIVIETGRGGEIYYVSNDGKYLLNGNMFNTASREDLTENRKSGIRKDVLDKLEKKQSIEFFPEDMKHHITVFTDIDCGYCRKMHNEMKEYNELGIGISYLFFPRSGENTPSFDKAISVWCSEDQQEAMTNAKSGMDMESKKCDNPVKTQYDAGKASGVTGTPAIVLDDGRLLPGYVPPATLLQRLEMLNAE